MNTKHQHTAEYKKFSDEELLRRYAAKHEHAAIASLYERYRHIVFGVCMKHLHDADAARRMTEKIFSDLMVNEKALLKVERFKPWLYERVKEACNTPLSDTQKKAEVAEDWQNMLMLEDVLETLQAGMAQLPKEQRNCIQLFYTQQMTFEEIALQTGLSTDKVKQQIQQGRNSLKMLVEEQKK